MIQLEHYQKQTILEEFLLTKQLDDYRRIVNNIKQLNINHIMSRDNEYTELRNALIDTLNRVSDNNPALEMFREGYEFRKSIIGLKESDCSSGLTGALERALAFYHEVKDLANAKPDRKPVDAEFRTKLHESFYNLPDNIVGRLSRTLERRSLDFRDPKVLDKILKNSFTNYAKRSRFSTTGDPW